MSDVLLLRYSIVLQSDGQMRSDIENIDPNEFIKAVREVDKDWDGAGLVAQGLKYAIEHFKNFDADFDKYLLTL